jgi:omega-amidase
MYAHLIQFDIVWEDKLANHALVRELVDSAPINAGDLIVLPELFDVGFTLDTDVAIDIHSTTRSFLQQLADSTGCVVHGSRATKHPVFCKALNCATITKPNTHEPICEYAKIHPFSFGRETESYIGGEAVTTYQWGTGKDPITVCPIVCYDLRFPELFRLGVKKGAQAFVMGANWPSARIAHWRTLCIARAIENQAFVIAVNRTGEDPYLSYPGNSMVVDPTGVVLGEMGDEQGVLSIEIDPKLVTDWRASFPALNDMKLI